MDDVLPTVIPATLPSGREIQIAVTDLGGEEQVAWRPPPVAEVIADIKELATTVMDTLADLPGRKVTLEFGVGFGVDSGSLVAVLMKASAVASLKVTVELSD